MNKEVIKYLSGRFIPAAVSLAVIIIAIRFMGVVEYGRFSLVICTVLLIMTLSYHWVQVSMLRFLGTMPKDNQVVMGRFYQLSTLMAIVAAGLTMMASRLLFHLNWTETGLVGVFTFLNHYYLYHQAILHAYHCSIRSAILEGTDQILILAVFLTGLLAIGIRSASVLLAAMAAGVAGVLILRWLIRPKGLAKAGFSHFYWDSRFTGKVVSFGWNAALWLFFSQLLASADRYFIYGFMDIGEAGSYSALKDLLFKGITFAVFPVYTSYQAKIGDHWNSRHKPETWKILKEALSFEILIFIILFIAFMVVKPYLFRVVLVIPELDNWLLYLPVLLSAFLWQMVLMLQRYLELAFRMRFVLLVMGATVGINMVMNLVFVPIYGLVASSVSLLASSLFYAVLIFFRCLSVEKSITGTQKTSADIAAKPPAI